MRNQCQHLSAVAISSMITTIIVIANGSTAQAECPDRPLRFIVPTAPGG